MQGQTSRESHSLQSVAGAHGCCPVWVVHHNTVVETVHMALEEEKYNDAQYTRNSQDNVKTLVSVRTHSTHVVLIANIV